MTSKFKDWLLSEIVRVTLERQKAERQLLFDDVTFYIVKLDTLMHVKSQLEQLK